MREEMDRKMDAIESLGGVLSDVNISSQTSRCWRIELLLIFAHLVKCFEKVCNPVDTTGL